MSIIARLHDYYPFGLTHNQNQGRELNNKYLFNGGAEWQNEFDLNLHMTPNRMLDPVLGRFWGIDKLSDLMPGSSPMAYGYNNPIFFNDPLGLAGIPGCDECEGTVLEEVVVTASRLPQIDYSLYFSNSNPVYRNLGLRAKSNDREYIQHAFNQSPIQYGEGLGYTTQFQQGINTIAGGVSSSLVFGTAGVVGSTAIIYGAPILADLAVTYGPQALSAAGNFGFRRAAFDAGIQVTFNLATRKNWYDIDIADVAFTGLGLNPLTSAVGGSLLDVGFVNGDFNLSTPFGGTGTAKGLGSTAIDFGVGLVGGYGHSFITTSGFKLYSGSMSGSAGNVGYSLKGMSSTYSDVWQLPVLMYSTGASNILKGGSND